MFIINFKSVFKLVINLLNGVVMFIYVSIPVPSHVVMIILRDLVILFHVIMVDNVLNVVLIVIRPLSSVLELI